MIWRTKHIYVDVETGEVIEKVKWSNYRVVNKKTKTHVYKSTGYKTITHECKRDEQLRLFAE